MTKVTFLGQSSLRFEFGSTVLYTDPYFSDHVAQLEGQEFKRQVPIPLDPHQISDGDWTCISHAHLDHLDLESILPMSKASAQMKFCGPEPVMAGLRQAGVESSRLVTVKEEGMDFGSGLSVYGIPAAHPSIERNEKNQLHFCGFVYEYQDVRCYFAGDTAPDQEIFDCLKKFEPIRTAFIPVNEQNYFKQRRGIIGNMSIREAFEMASILKVEKLVPLHWDMFLVNGAYRQEIELVYEKMRPDFKMEFNPEVW